MTKNELHKNLISQGLSDQLIITSPPFQFANGGCSDNISVAPSPLIIQLLLTTKLIFCSFVLLKEYGNNNYI